MNTEMAYFSCLQVRFTKVFYGHMWSYLDKLKMIKLNNFDPTCKINELFDPAGLTSEVLSPE